MEIDRKSVRRLVIGGFVLFLLIYFYLFVGERFLAAAQPLIIGIIAAYVMNIMINWFDKHDFLYNRGKLKNVRLHEIFSVLEAVIVLLLCCAFIFGFVIPQLTACALTLLDKVPSGIRYILNLDMIKRLIPEDTMQTLQMIDWSKWITHLISIVNKDDLFSSMTSTASTALAVFTTLLFGILFGIYFTTGRKEHFNRVRRLAKALLPEGKEEKVFYYFRLANECCHDFIFCQGMQGLIMGVISTAFLLAFRFPYATMIGVMNGFCALLPVIGGYVGAILGMLVILADSPRMAIMFLIVIVVIQNVVGTIVFPRLVGKSLGLPAVWTLAAVTIGGGLAGIGGIMIGVPGTAFAYRCLQEKVLQKEAEEREKAKASEGEIKEAEAEGGGGDDEADRRKEKKEE